MQKGAPQSTKMKGMRDFGFHPDHTRHLMRIFRDCWKMRRSILFRMMLSCIMIFAVPMLLVFSLLYRSSDRQAILDAGERCVVSLRSLSSTMDEILRGGNGLQSQIQADPLFFDTSFSPEFLSGGRDAKTFYTLRSMSRTLYHYYLSNTYLSEIDLYNPYADILFSSKLYATRKLFRSPSPEQINEVSMPQGAKPRAWYIRPDENQIVSYSMPFAADKPSQNLNLRLSFPLDTLTSRYRSLFPDEEIGLMIRFDGIDTPVLSSGGMDVEQFRQENEKWSVYTAQGRRYLSVRFHSSYTGWDYYLWGPVSCFSSAQDVFRSYSGLFHTCLIVIFLLLSIYLYNQIIVPVRTLSNAMRVAEQGDLSVRVELNRQDELGRIGQQFNVLLGSIEHLIRENYETRILKNDFELRYIQNQLKEHFLYNTLDSIHWVANANHVPQISEMIFNLSRFFRLTLNEGSDTITVRQAAEILRSYLMLVNTRMDNGMDVQITVAPGLENKKTYKYFFQPIVENAYQHGLRQQLGGKLRVSFTQAENGWLVYTVEDNGVGMSAEKLESLREDIQNPTEEAETSGHHFALKNIVRQLRLYFQNDYCFTIDSQPAMGTTVIISFPVKEDYASVSADDCR